MKESSRSASVAVAPMSFGQYAGQVGTQEIFLELVGIALVLQVFEEQHGNRDVAHRLEAEHDHRTGYGADIAAAGRPEIGRIDQAQQFVGQREILLRMVFDSLSMLSVSLLAILLMALTDSDRPGNRSCGACDGAGNRFVACRLPLGEVQIRLGLRIVIQRLGKLAGRLKTQCRVACHGLEQDGAQSSSMPHLPATRYPARRYAA